MVLWLIGLRVGTIWYIFPQTIPEVHVETTVQIAWFPEKSQANTVATIFYNEGWLDMVTTMIGENGSFNTGTVSPTNDHWLCQLNYRWHKNFIDSEDFKDPIKQAHYCVGVRKDAVKKHRLSTTFYAYGHRNKYKGRVTVITKKYYNLFSKRFYLK